MAISIAANTVFMVVPKATIWSWAFCTHSSLTVPPVNDAKKSSIARDRPLGEVVGEGADLSALSPDDQLGNARRQGDERRRQGEADIILQAGDGEVHHREGDRRFLGQLLLLAEQTAGLVEEGEQLLDALALAQEGIEEQGRRPRQEPQFDSISASGILLSASASSRKFSLKPPLAVTPRLCSAATEAFNEVTSRLSIEFAERAIGVDDLADRLLVFGTADLQRAGALGDGDAELFELPDDVEGLLAAANPAGLDQGLDAAAGDDRSIAGRLGTLGKRDELAIEQRQRIAQHLQRHAAHRSGALQPLEVVDRQTDRGRHQLRFRGPSQPRSGPAWPGRTRARR